MKYCIDCKHIRVSTTGLIPDYCESPKIPIDLVTGKPKLTLCKDLRYLPIYGSKPNLCGEEAKWFEAKEFEPVNEKEADLDDLSAIPFGR